MGLHCLGKLGIRSSLHRSLSSSFCYKNTKTNREKTYCCLLSLSNARPPFASLKGVLFQTTLLPTKYRIWTRRREFSYSLHLTNLRQNYHHPRVLIFIIMLLGGEVSLCHFVPSIIGTWDQTTTLGHNYHNTTNYHHHPQRHHHCNHHTQIHHCRG